MNLTVLGAAGATGTQLVEQALTAGHHVTALVRSPEKLTITNPNLHVVQGDATDRAALSRAMKAAGAVVSTLGAAGPVIAEAARAIVAVAKQEPIYRPFPPPPKSPRGRPPPGGRTYVPQSGRRRRSQARLPTIPGSASCSPRADWRLSGRRGRSEPRPPRN
jgi:hypothetical protein